MSLLEYPMLHSNLSNMRIHQSRTVRVRFLQVGGMFLADSVGVFLNPDQGSMIKVSNVETSYILKITFKSSFSRTDSTHSLGRQKERYVQMSHANKGGFAMFLEFFIYVIESNSR